MGYDMYRETPLTEEETALLAPIETRLNELQEALRARLNQADENVFKLDMDPDKFQAALDAGESYMMAQLLSAGVSDETIKAAREVELLADEASKLDTSYFRLNIWGMSRYCDVMIQSGMAYEGNPLRFPHPNEFNISESEMDLFEAWTEGGDIEAELSERFQAFDEATKAVLGHHDPRFSGISIQKFWSNDGWLVTEQECSQAVEAWRDFEQGGGTNSLDEEMLEAVSSPLWKSWIHFLDVCSRCGGFRVW